MKRSFLFGLALLFFAGYSDAALKAVANSSTSAPGGVGVPINLQALGACGITDGTAIFNVATATAATTGQALYIPGGCTINHSGTLLLNGLKLYGDGLTSILNATDPAATNPHTSLYIEGSGTVVSGINFTCSTTAPRSAQVYADAIAIPAGVGATLSNFSIDHNYFTGTFAGPFVEIDYAGTNGDISFNRMTGTTLANPIITQAPVSYLNIHHNFISGISSDNCIEASDYTNSTTPTSLYINITNNQINGCVDNGIFVGGGAHINVIGNQIVGTQLPGIAVQSTLANTLSASYDINIAHNAITGAAATSHNYYIFVNGRSGFPVTDVNISGNTLNVTTSTGTAGMQIGACDTCSSSTIFTNRINVSDNIINGDGTNGSTGIVARGVNDLTVKGNTVTAMLKQAFAAVAGNSGALKLINNHFSNLSLTSSGTYEAVFLSNSGFSHVDVIGNSYAAGANTVSHFLTCTASYDLWATQNIGSDTSQSGCTLNAWPVPLGGTGLTTVTSGGVLYGSSLTTLSVSGLLGANNLMVGGGIAGAPSTIATGTAGQVLTAGSPPTWQSGVTYPALPAISALASGDLIAEYSAADTQVEKATLAQLITYLNSNLTIPLGTGVSGTLLAAQEPAHTGDVTNSVGSLALTIAANAVTNAKAAQMAANTIKCNNTGSLANATDCTVAQARTMLSDGYVLLHSAIPFVVPPSGFFANNGVVVIGQAPSSSATVSFSATSGSGVTMTFSAATLLGTAADVGRILTILDTTYKYATITAQSSTTVATVTLTGTLSGTGPFANNTIWLSGTPTTNTTAFSVPLSTTYANAYLFFPANAIVSGSASGWYFCQMASSTQGTCFNNTYTSGQPSIPGSPTAFSTTGPGAYTQSTGSSLTALSISLAGNTLGVNGELDIDVLETYNNSAGTKTLQILYGSSVVGTSNQTTTTDARITDSVLNAGLTNAQTAYNTNSSNTTTTTGLSRTAVDSTAAQNVLLKSQLVTAATDFMTIESYSIKVYPTP